MTRVSYVMPSRNRPEVLARTLDAIGRLPAHDAEVIVVDDASEPAVTTPAQLANGIPVIVCRRDTRIGAAARNEGVTRATASWIIMLDDDSAPLDLGHLDVIDDAPDDLVAIGAEIFLPDGRHEAGGLPEVIIGCGAAIRRDAFMSVGGYDSSFDYYVEEYDLCARFIAAGGRVTHDDRFRVRHEKVTAGRDMNRILARLIRNNGWVIARYAPDAVRADAMHEATERYRGIAVRESAEAGYEAGCGELEETLAAQPRLALSVAQWDRFVGRDAARDALSDLAGRSCAIVEPGKGASAISDALADLGATIVDESVAEVRVAGTLSPGPARDVAAPDRRIIDSLSPRSLAAPAR